MWCTVLLFLPGQQPSISSRALRLVSTKMTNSNIWLLILETWASNYKIQVYFMLHWTVQKQLEQWLQIFLTPKTAHHILDRFRNLLKQSAKHNKTGGLNGSMTNCLKINKRQNWVDHLPQQNHLTSTKQYNEKRMKKIERKLPTIFNYWNGHIIKSNRRNNHQSKQNLEEPKKRKVHENKNLTSKTIKN